MQYLTNVAGSRAPDLPLSQTFTVLSAAAKHLTSSVGSRVTNLSLRPLLFAAGAAATAVGIYYYFKARGDGEETAEQADTPLTQDDSMPDPDLMSDEDGVNGVSVTQTDSAVPEEPLSKAEEENQEVEVSSAPVARERSDLEDRVRKLENLICEAHRECERKTMECEREQRAHSILRLQYNRLRETLSENEKSLMVTLAEAVTAYEQARECNGQMEKEKSDLTYHVHKLRGTVQQLEETLYEKDITCGVIKQDLQRAGEAYSILKSQYEETLKQRDELQMERERDWEAHGILKTQENGMEEHFKQCEELPNNHSISLGFKKSGIL